MRKFVHLSMVLLLLSIALSAVCPVLAQEPAAAEEAEVEAVSEEAEAETPAQTDAQAETDQAHSAAAEAAPEAHSPDHSGDASAPGATNNTPIALLLTGMILFFAVGALMIRRSSRM